MKNRGRLAPCLAAALSIALPLTIGCLPPDSSGSLGAAGAPASAGTGGYAGTGGTTGAAGAAGTTAVPTGRGGSAATAGAGAGGSAGTTAGVAGSRGGAGDGPGGHGGGGATGLAGVGGMSGQGGTAGAGGGRAGSGGGAGGASVPPTFTQIYKSILTVYCQGSECHNPGAQKNVSFATQAKAYTSSRALITAGSTDRSTFYNEVYTGAMPPVGDSLSDSQIKMIADWINAGAMNN